MQITLRTRLSGVFL